ncbi:rhamnulokinase [Paenibacillus sp.]|uniref:rhamnulokinase n=1 Tax=Paenibacillus sp. TaxID=58172 RepID=UPI002D3398AD|nr:rhamnulokinase [Paenibacillus sp.]HZG55660.1 rhamnulokinase [Paenibacillus sp.]
MSVLAFDLGASSGRAVAGRLEGGKLVVEEIHRFPNDPVQVGGRLYWDILRLYHEIKQGIVKARQRGLDIRSVGIDSWAVDFGLIGANGELIANPYHYRDHHTDGMMEETFAKLSKASIYAKTGLQFLQFNTMYQLAALAKADSPALAAADKLLMIPDLLRYFLTGVMTGEYTNASTTQLLGAVSRDWDDELLAGVGVKRSLLPAVAQPGTVVGPLTPALQEELLVGPIPVVTVAEHDTASAVVAVPALDADFAYLSCGTWSLLGTELDRPVLTEQALAWNFTNEGGIGGTYRLLKNIMGLWLVQECKRAWDKAGGASHSFAELAALAAAAPAHAAYIDPDDDRFLNPSDMPSEIRAYCRETGQAVPDTEGEVIRCVLESLAMKYRLVLERTEALAGKTFGGLHIVGGGIQNELLCRLTANAIRRPVWTGPAEGSAIGNVVVQLIAAGDIAGLAEGRRLVRDSFGIATYEPEDAETWAAEYERFLRIVKLTS